MKKYAFLFLISIFFLLVHCAGHAPEKWPSDKSSFFSEYLQQILPVDPQVIKDTLENGLTYYIRQNAQPQKRAELRLVVNAGAVLETEEQQGLAHFCEHMAFNGTRNFPKHKLVDYLEGIGMKFGPEINAYTGFDETVYMLQIPTDKPEIIETAFQILLDWAGAISFEDQEIEKERGVIIEEWRMGRGAEARLRDQQLPILFQGSKYANRLPIGQKAVLDTFHHQTLRQFYADWYRPDLMAVIAVGDFETNKIQNVIRSIFSQLPRPLDAKKRHRELLPDHSETLFAIASDPEARFSQVAIYYKLPVTEEQTVNDYRSNLIEILYLQMMNERLSELSRKADAPFLVAFADKGRYVRNSEILSFSAQVKENGIPAGCRALLLEMKRAQQYGFTPGELERSKAKLLRMMEQALLEKDKTESEKLAAEYVRNFLNNEPIPGIEKEVELLKKLLPDIHLAEVNQLSDQWKSDKNRVIMASYPDKEGISQLVKDDLVRVLTESEQVEISPYVDNFLDQPLIQSHFQPVKICDENYVKELELTELTLANGVRVILKPTDFKNDEVLFTAISPGGYSLAADSILVPARTAVAVVREGGIGNFSQEQLKKKLADKMVTVTPFIDELSEGISGNASPADLETLFQLIYLYFTQPREDSAAFIALKNKFKGFYENRSASPEAAFLDTISVTITQYHPRYKPWTIETVEKMEQKKSIEFYRNRFADASDFIFIFVGNFQQESIKSLVQTYLGNLPVLHRQETWKDVTYNFPPAVVEKVVKKGVEYKSQSQIIFHGDDRWSLRKEWTMETLLEVMRIRLRERIREDLSGTYGVRLGGTLSRYPRERFQITISFGTNPERVDELTREIFVQIDSLQNYGPKDIYLSKVREMSLQQLQVDLKENDFWLDQLENCYFLNENPLIILEKEKFLQNVLMVEIQNAARRYLDKNNYIQVTLYPERN